MICLKKLQPGLLSIFLACGVFAAEKRPVLILHDSAGQFGWIGGLHALMLANLMGHFDLRVQVAPVESYRAGEIDRARAVFYLGTVYDNALPESFRREVANTTKPVCWFRYNLWQLTNAASSSFATLRGFRFDSLDQTGGHLIRYREETFTRDSSDPELGRTTIVDPARASAVAWAEVPASTGGLPYIVRGAGNFWYVADSPFSFISEEDRYLVFADVLHDILGIAHAEDRRALIRIEDVSPNSSPEQLRAVADCLAAESVPFVVSVIPVHVDPRGTANHGLPRTLTLRQAPAVQEALRHMIARGGQILLHGYTHQYRDVPNPYTAMSGDDYEFFRVTVDSSGAVDRYQPLPEDSRPWAHGRVTAGLLELKRAGFTAAGWVTPHYAASAIDYEVFGVRFPLTVQRALYFENTGNVRLKQRHSTKHVSDETGELHLAGQFFPYVIQNDIYGQKIIPENLGNIDLALVNGAPVRSAADMIRIARRNKVVRDGWASGFFHPYLDVEQLRELVRGVKAEGYVFTPLTPRMR